MNGVAPIVVSIDLPVTPARAFAAFAGRFSEWWPVATHTLTRQAETRCSLDARPGGAVLEVAPDGVRHLWGSVESVDPARRLRFTWHPDREPESAQWIEVVFLPTADGVRVTLTHGGWENLGEIAPILRREYVSGWQYVLGTIYANFIRSNLKQ